VLLFKMKFLTCIIWFHVGPHKDYAVFCLVPSIVKIRASKGGQWSLVWADVERTMRCKVAMLVHVPLENRLLTRVSTEVTFWHSAEYGSDFRCNSDEIPRNSAEFRGIAQKSLQKSKNSAEFRVGGIPWTPYS
jgi:hypothetical protein